MNKIFCKRNLIVGGIMLGVLLCIIFALVFGKTDASESNRKADVLIYCLVAIFLAVVMFNSIIKIIDKKTKIYFIILFCLFAIWLGIKIFDKVSGFNDENDYTWYLLYIPLLFIPTMWFITNNQIYIKNKTYKNVMAIISLSISFLLFLLVLTNDFHQFVFIFQDDVAGNHVGDYKYNIGYFVIYAFIFLEILTTIVLFYVFSLKKTTIKQKILPSIVILLVLVYSILYVATDIFVPYLSDMTLVYTVLGTLLVYVLLKCGLVKNSGAYFEFFETCNVPLAIVNEKADIEYQNTRYEEQKASKNMLLQKQKLNSGTLLVLKDVGKLKSLQNNLKKEIEKLEYSNKILKKNKEILQKEKQIEFHTMLYNKVEKQIKNKRFVLEQLLNNLPTKITKENKNQTKEILNEIKIVVGYLKRKTSLILFAEQKNEISKDELRLLFNESFNDLKWLKINAGIGLDEKPVPISAANKFYDIYNELLTKIKKENLDIWLTIKKRDVWEFEITFDGIRLEKPELNLPKEYKMEYIFTLEEDSTIVCFKEACV
ncbi:MAG: histidine kinase N-terminal 7TM domain-containing protein [Christensenellales bacterium]